MKVFITKYALSAGIREAEAEPSSHGVGRIVVKPDVGYIQFFGPTEYRDSLEGAKAQAEKRRATKIASLKKQIKKIEGLVF